MQSEVRRSDKAFVHPEEEHWADPLLSWLNPLIRTANERPLKEDDVWPCPTHETVHQQGLQFWEAWKNERTRAEEVGTEPSMVRALICAFGHRFFIAGCYQLSFMLFQLAQPFLVAELVQFISEGGPVSTGVGLALGFAAASLICSISIAQALSHLRQLGVAVRCGVMMAVYEQALRLTTAARMSSTVGQTTNLMAIDAEKLNIAAQFVHFIWHGPIAGLAICGILIYEIGYAPALAGAGCMVVLFPIQNHLAEAIGTVRRSMVKDTDERVKLTNELLQAIRVIKLYAWEKAIEERVTEVREVETKTLREYLNSASRLREVLFAAQPIFAIIMFSVAAEAMNRPLTVVSTFRLLAFLNITRFPLNLLAQALKNYKDGAVSIQRLQKFFLLPTLNSVEERKQMVEHPAITLSDASFTWIDSSLVSASSNGHSKKFSKDSIPASTTQLTSSDDKSLNRKGEYEMVSPNSQTNSIAETDRNVSYFQFQNLNFSTKKDNELIAIIGTVGSGKSSFLSAILGEMVQLQGERGVQGTTAYCAQTPWIQNLTLRQNVLFATPANEAQNEIDQRRYEASIHGAALLPDIRILPSGDMTEIGEKGINLSGGQKARVALARAFCSSNRSQIYLLDDPFSAVDSNTGNQIFRHGVLGLLQDKLRIIALNSHMHLLRHFDRILVLDQGRIFADGSWDDLITSHPELMSKLTGMQSLVSATASLGAVSISPVSGSPTISPSPSSTVLAEQAEKVTGKASDEETGASEPISSSKIETSVPSPPPVFLGNLSGKAPEKKLIWQERVDSSLTTFVVYLKYFSAALSSSSAIRQVPFYEDSETINRVIMENQTQESQKTSKKQSPVFSSQHLWTGFLVLFGLLAVFSVAQLFRVAVDYFLAQYATHYYDDSARRRNYWKNFYYSSFGCLIFSLLLRSVYVNYFAVRSSRFMHAALLRRVLSAPIPTFFDTHTVGAILNRFSKDVETLDVNIPEFMLQLLINWAQVLSIFALCIWAAYWFVIVLVPLIYGFIKVYNYFSSASRGLKRLESVTRSPIYSSLSETLIGLDTIRAFGDSPRFAREHEARMDRNHKLFYHLWMCISWMTIRLELATSLILLAVALLAVMLRVTTDAVSPIALGLALSFGLQLTALFQRCVQLAIEMTTYMTSTERVLQYLEDVPVENNTYSVGDVDPIHTLHGNSDAGGLKQEEYQSIRTDDDENKAQEVGEETSVGLSAVVVHTHDDATVPSNWPATGAIVLDNVWMQYRDNPPVLRGLTLRIAGGERIGVCGRTGAGKSSVMMALFRVVELSAGHIYLDGRDIAQVPLTQLRSSLAIIPQDPVLLTGTLRFQLDPFLQYSDAEVWQVLQQVNLLSMVESLPMGLEEPIAEGGENLSQGQRQLLCIARALLRCAKCLIVDEGTSAVDPHTDALIQTVLREQVRLRGTTVLAIAHRLQTIVDFDKIVVLGQGRLLEYDTPQALLQNPQSAFASMLRESVET